MPEDRAAPQPDHSGVRIPPPLIYAAVFVLGLLLERRWPLPPPSPRAVAWVLAGIGLWLWCAISVWALLHFFRRKTSAIPDKPTTAIITAGPFRWTRNPLYLSFARGYAGLAFSLDKTWPLLWLPAVLSIIDRSVIAREERYLERKFGEEYSSYKRRVRRWL
jgi:protein-S-isoprenylcysteine O-methyltransferase Ste14